MAFMSKKPMMQHERSMQPKSGGAGLMTRTDPLAQPGEEGEGTEPEPHHEAIHEHLRAMHAETGHGHSHIEHHLDGSHTSHHIDHDGEISGPHHHASAEELVDHLKSHLPEEESEIEHGDEEPEYE
jgi:hypothetical protein